MNPKFPLLMAAVLCCGPSASHAQTALLTAPELPANTAKTTEQATARKSMRQIRVKNVPPSLMAWWLDPKNHSAPLRFPGIGRPQHGGVAPESSLPEGVDRLVAVDPQNTLLVFGTQSGAREIEDMVSFLDRPLRQVEIEAHWVQISPQDANAFGIVYNAGTGNFNARNFVPAPKNAPQIGFVRGNFGATLYALVAQNKAKILNAPRVLAINNTPVALNSFTFAPTSIKFQGAAADLAKLFEGQTKIGTQHNLSVTPTVNADNTMTVLLSTSSQLKLSTEQGTELLAAPSAPALESVINLRDGDTVALFHPSTPSEAGKFTLVFVTARIVRRAEDDVKPVAPQR